MTAHGMMIDCASAQSAAALALLAGGKYNVLTVAIEGSTVRCWFLRPIVGAPERLSAACAELAEVQAGKVTIL